MFEFNGVIVDEISNKLLVYFFAINPYTFLKINDMRRRKQSRPITRLL